MAHGRQLLLGARFELDLFINLRPIKLLDPRLCPLKDKGVDDVDFIISLRRIQKAVMWGLVDRFARTLHEVSQQDLCLHPPWCGANHTGQPTSSLESMDAVACA